MIAYNAGVCSFRGSNCPIGRHRETHLAAYNLWLQWKFIIMVHHSTCTLCMQTEVATTDSDIVSRGTYANETQCTHIEVTHCMQDMRISAVIHSDMWAAYPRVQSLPPAAAHSTANHMHILCHNIIVSCVA